MNAFEDKSKAPDNAKEQSFDSVLRALKKEDFNLVYDIALAVMEDERQSLLDRIKAGLVAARFAYFHRLIERAIELIQRIPPLLEKFGKIWLKFTSLKLKLYENSDNEYDNVAKSKALLVAYATLMIEILPASSDIREMVENSLKIDPHNANPLIVLVHQLDSKSAHEVMAARIPEIDPTSPYAPYLFSIVIFLLHNKSIYRELQTLTKTKPARTFFIFVNSDQEISIKTTFNRFHFFNRLLS